MNTLRLPIGTTCFALLLLLGTIKLHAQSLPYYLILDEGFSQNAGSSNLTTLHHCLHVGMESVIPQKIGLETRAASKLGAVGFRLAKLSLLELPIDWFIELAQHEVFGHGARIRERPTWKVNYNLSLLFPYGSSSGSVSFQLQPGNRASWEDRTLFAMSGNEGNLVLSENLEARMLLQNEIHYRQGLFYLLSRDNLLLYSHFTYWGALQGDVSRYVDFINLRQGPNGRILNYSTLYFQNIVALANPLQFYATWAVLKRNIWDGETTMSKLPMFRIGAARFLPAMNYNLTPFGPEFILNNYLRLNQRLFHLKVRVGDPRPDPHFGLALAGYNILSTTRFRLNANLEGWSQPSFALGGYQRIDSLPAGLGAAASVSSTVFPFKAAPRLGMHLQMGYKTKGYMMGERLAATPILRLGLALDMNPER